MNVQTSTPERALGETGGRAMQLIGVDVGGTFTDIVFHGFSVALLSSADNEVSCTILSASANFPHPYSQSFV